MILFAIVALVWSGLHAEPADAHENAADHASAHAVSAHGDADHDPSDKAGGDQHACHHHCPNAPAERAPDTDHSMFVAKVPTFATLIPALHPTGLAPPLDPPIS